MNWQQKLAALQALTDTSLRMRSPGDWYVCANNRNIVDGGFLRGAYGNGSTPEEAVESDWAQIAESKAVLKVGKHYCHWNGFMWEKVKL